ncbi:FUSC family protein [Allopusillimonas ginsengisoli]|nr:FUSC family protein [Allopusillimonas ginsengisoli]
MSFRLQALQRFFYSHYFFGGIRQSVGVMMPALVLAGIFHMYAIGFIASIGAACVAVIDQPGGPRRYGTNGMLAAILLGSLTALVTGLVAGHSLLVWIAIPAMVFMFSMLTVFGKQGGLLGFACLLIMTLTLRQPLTSHDVLQHTAYSFFGGVFYFVYSFVIHKLMWHREEQQALSVAMFATADYMEARAQFYDVNIDLETSYRRLIHAQAVMTEKQQAARDTVLRELPHGSGKADQLRARALNIFIDMVALLDTLVATHTDYATLRRTLPESDVLVFGRDALRKLSRNVSDLAFNIARGRPAKERHSVKAELRAIEYEIETYRKDGMVQNNPEVYALLVQILRRLRNATRLVDRMGGHLREDNNIELVDMRLEQSLNRFLTRSKWRLGMITSNLRLDSSHCRYALRIALAIALAMVIARFIVVVIPEEGLGSDYSGHSYWIILTIIVIMKPGFALTRQRNGWRLFGTLIGCGVALVVFNLTSNNDIYLVVLIMASIMGYSLVQVNYMLAAIFNTLFVLLVFHFLAPGGSFVIGERLIDTVLGCIIALLFSYVLPWWEHSFMGSLANALKRANQEYLSTGLHYASLTREQQRIRSSEPSDSDSSTDPTLDADQHEAELRWRLARKNMHIAFSNYAAAFYRMMDEPVNRQKHVPQLNNLLIQNHILASQITAAIPILASLETVPPGIEKSMAAVTRFLDDQEADPPASIETTGNLATLAYPLRQMVKAASLIRKDMQGLHHA